MLGWCFVQCLWSCGWWWCSIWQFWFCSAGLCNNNNKVYLNCKLSATVGPLVVVKWRQGILLSLKLLPVSQLQVETLRHFVPLRNWHFFCHLICLLQKVSGVAPVGGASVSVI